MYAAWTLLQERAALLGISAAWGKLRYFWVSGCEKSSCDGAKTLKRLNFKSDFPNP